MRKISFLVIIAAMACTTAQKTEQSKEEPKRPTTYVEIVQAYRDSVNYDFTNGLNGVLLYDDLKAGKKLQFYPPNEKYRIKARFERIQDGEIFEMPTTTERLPLYRRYGILHFELDGQEYSLHVYQSMDLPEYLFCPFKDLTNGPETYGAGRYLDFSLEDMEDPYIDFNYCYNPYCAYNYKYSCPIPPIENHLDVRIEAGVKKWH